MLIFDFDRTLYGVDQMKNHVIKALLRNEYDQTKFFDELSNFVYPDVVPFFEKHKDTHEFKMITYGEEDIQRRKVEHSGIDHYFSEILYLNNDTKGPLIERCVGDYQGEVAFIDDGYKHLLEMKETCPQVRGIRIKRKGAKEGLGGNVQKEEFEVIYGLEELESLLQL